MIAFLASTVGDIVDKAVEYIKGESVTETLLRAVTDGYGSSVKPVTECFTNIGIGIGSIMLLIVAVYYLISILDGGKFQMKMCIPVLIFFLVCNFSWVSKPVCDFVFTIQKTLVQELRKEGRDIRKNHGCTETATFDDMYSKYLVKNGLATEMSEDEIRDMTGDDNTIDKAVSSNGGLVTGSTVDTTTSVSAISNGSTRKEVNKSLSQFSAKGKDNIIRETSGLKNPIITMFSYTFTGLLSAILSFLLRILGNVVECLGGLMTGLIVAFGPITFAFAIFPGQAGTIKSWFLRLCQFSLYGPIVALISCFSSIVFDIMATANALSFLYVIALEACTIICITSVPTIASMIIEGAQGAVSLSNGLQMLAHGVGTGASFVMGKGGNTGNVIAGMKEMGVAGLVKAGAQSIKSGTGFKGFTDSIVQRGTRTGGGPSGMPSK